MAGEHLRSIEQGRFVFRDFATFINTDRRDWLQRVVQGAAKNGQQVTGQFDVATVYKGNNTYDSLGERHNMRRCFVDGDFGLVIREVSGNMSLSLAVVSINLEPRDFFNVVDHDFRAYPRIVQMQGCTDPHKDELQRYERAIGFLSQFKMVDVHVELIEELTRAYGFPALAILPAEGNPNRGREDFHLRRVRTIYDKNAKKLGFTRKGLDSMFVRELLCSGQLIA